MAIDVRTRSITALPTGGKDINGVAKSNKVLVVGDIDITTYTSGGEPIKPADLGLSTIDGLFVSMRDVDDTLPAAAQLPEANYVHTTNLLVCCDGTGSDDPNASAQLRFVAIGDSALPELT